MRKNFIIAVICGMILSLGNVTWASNTHRIGAGVHYWVTLEDIDVEDVDEDGLALIVSYQYQIAEFFKLEADIEFLGEGYAGADSSVFSPQGYFLAGRGLYGGGGVGINYSDGDFAGSPFFALRAGVDLEILPSIYLDINANYRFEKWDFDRIRGDIDVNTITLGAIVRLEF